MKKIIVLLAVVGLFISGSAFAVHNVTDEYGRVINTIPDDVWADAMARAKVFQTSKLPLFYAGQSVTDEYGVVLSCEWFMFMGCQNPVNSPAYKTAMQGLARELIAKGWDYAFPMFSGWVNSVK
jgi:hypothetical protein